MESFDQFLAEASLASAKQEASTIKLLAKPASLRAPLAFEGMNSKYLLMKGNNAISIRSNSSMLKAGFIAAGGTT